ncbi:AlkA N-terminal domain-containing protein [Capillimicrobium parvum]|uniref:DNA-3-methyladenine glycosylase II n=1 Tax=Capillimicrobium parvum TaxID=2884022 RepID=A0A9E6XTP8_9ACTN|nr:AlkA N-terminal domain-containing protein [Capillimicrobium parvum]UGS34344.1 putative bifunctional transcriptional activator/DNA repair enzyme AlkA [Capillimicrobium parvum]
MTEDFDRCYRAIRSRDPRFDGWFITAVTSTGIYCRPSCPAMTPKRENVRFYPSAAAAQQAGFRACKRCRPDAAPGSPEWDGRADVVARAMRMIADGVVDRDGVPGLAAQLGYSVRQLQRLLLAEVGAGPIAVARAQRAQTARVLIETTALSMTDVAFASGFASIRQFNDTVRAVFASSPTDLRRRAAARDGTTPAPGAIAVRLPFRRPLCPDNLFGHLAATAVPGVEEVRGATYRRTLRLTHGAGIVELTPAADHVACRLMLADLRDLAAAISRSRWLLDLDADPVAVDEQLATDPALAPIVRAAPGRRVPRCADGPELAVRAVLGQQISTAAARTYAARLVTAIGEPVEDRGGGLTHLFPAPEALREVPVAMPASRRRTLAALLDALAGGRLDLGPGCDREAALDTLGRLPGFGPWTIGTIAMRALGDPDAFVAGDLGVRRAAEALGLPATPGALTARSAAWRPWRAYAVQYLWSTGDHEINRWPATSIQEAA